MAGLAARWMFAVRPVWSLDVTPGRARWAVVPQRTEGPTIDAHPATTTRDDDRRHEDSEEAEARLAWQAPADVDDVRLITVEDAAERLSICRTKVYELIARRELPAIKIGRSRRVSVEDLRVFVAQHRSA